MPRYIDKDELVIWLNAVDGIIADGTVHPQTLYKQIITDIENFGAADVVEVVRCEDCQYYYTGYHVCLNSEYCGVFVKMPCDGFCSRGERKEQP